MQIVHEARAMYITTRLCTLTMRMCHVGADKILARPGDYINSMIKAAELNNNILPLRQSNKVTHFI